MGRFPLPEGWTESAGVYVSPRLAPADTGYPEEIREWLNGVERTHFWFRSRADLIAGAVGNRVPAGGWLELGCGHGHLLTRVSRVYDGPCYGQDVSPAALHLASRNTDATLFLCGMGDVPLGSVGGVGLFDVIEHLQEDTEAVKTACRYLAFGGAMLITVPAHPWLWSRLDIVSGHRRRYTRAGLVDVMRASGLHVEMCRPFFASLLAPVALRRFGCAVLGQELRRALAPPPRPLNAALRGITAVEAFLCLSGLSPLGTSWLAIGRKL